MAIPHLYKRVDEEIRCSIVDRIAQHYPDLKVTVRSAELVDGEGIVVRGMSISEPGATGPGAELLFHEEIFLQCNTELKELIGGQPNVTRVIMRQPVLRITRRPDGTWSCRKLLPVPRLSDDPPEVIVENGTIEIFDPLKSPASTFTLRNVNFTLRPPGSSDPVGTARKLQGTLVGDHLRRVGFEGEIQMDGGGWTIGGVLDGLEVSPELRNSLPGPLAAKLAVLGELRGQANLTFKVASNPAAAVPLVFDVSGNLKRARMDDSRLPHALTDMHAKVHANNQGISVDGLVARCGQATLVVSAWRSGFGSNSPMTVEAEIRQLELDRQLLDILPRKLQEQWHKYYPAGRIDADVKLSYDGRTWRPEASVRCLNVSFMHHKFPYRLEQGSGDIHLKDDRLEAHLTAYSRSQPVQIDCVTSNVSAAPVGWCEIRGNDMQIDEKLLMALQEKPRAFVRSLNPNGTIGFHMRLERREPNGPLHKRLLINLNRCSIRYDKFTYPLSNIRGTVEMHNDRWTLRGLEGTNDTGRVTCEGHMAAPAEGRQLFLRFVGNEVPLEEELRDALRPNVQRLWNELRPRGAIDLVADVRYSPGSKKVDVSLRARSRSENTSIDPVHFPYRLDKLRGELEYRDGYVTLRRFRAEHGVVRLTSNGYCDFPPDGSWHFHLEDLSVDRLKLHDREFTTALPGRLKKGLASLNPTGSVNIRGSFDLEGGPQPGTPLRSKWDVAVNFQQASIDCGIKLENVSGGVTLKGQFDGQHFHSRGELAVDSLTYKELQFTQVIGPLWMDGNRVLFGSWVDRREGQTVRQKPRSLTASLFGGTVFGDAWVTLGQTPRYGLHASLAGADLARCAREVVPGRQKLSGKMMGAIDLHGSGRSSNTIEGQGKVMLRDADIYELPLMIALLKILSIRTPDQTAFTKSDIDFHIAGEHIYFDRINFNGDAISLLGRGEMDSSKNIALSFYTMVGSGDWDLPIIRDVIGVASQQTLEINVDGTLGEPKITRKVLPVLSKALQQLDKELQEGGNSQNRFPQARQWMPNQGPK